MWLALYGMLVTKCNFTREEARDQVPLAEAFALAAHITETQSLVPMKRTTDGYVAQERFKCR